MNVSLFLTTLNLCMGGLVFLLGLIILRENPGHRLNRLVALMLFFGGIGAIFASLAFLGRPGAAPAAPGTELIQNLAYLWEFFFPTLFLFASIFPEERTFTRTEIVLPGRFWTVGFGTFVFAPHVFHFAVTLAVSFWDPHLTIPEVGPLKYAAPVIAVFAVFLRLFLSIHRALFSLVNLGFGIATMVLLFSSYRRAQVPRLKRQLGVIAVGLSACLLCYSFATSIPGLFNFKIDERLRAGLTVAALTLGPGSIAYSIVRYKFLDTKLLARRGILYALASGALVGLYLLVVGRLNTFLGQITGADARVFEPVFLIIALALFQPAIARLEEMLDRMLLKDPADYRNVVRQLGRELQTTIDLEVLLTRTIRTLSEALLLKTGHVVALTPAGPLSFTGAGQPLAGADLQRIAALLARISPRQTSYRLSDRVEGLSAEEQELLAGRFGVALVVPLRWRGDLVGALLLGEKLTGTAFTSEDVTLLTSLAGTVSVSLQNALLLRDRVAVARFEEELNLARQIQRTSLISEFPVIPRCEVHAIYIPSKHVGGDFYDVVSTGDGQFLIAIADVSGKGVPAALLSSMLQASLRTQATQPAPLPGILANINVLLYRSTAIHQFATFFLARIDGPRLALSFSNAGHNWPVVFRPNGERVFLERGGTILGILEQTEYQQGEVTLAPGDRVVLYTDGISEADNGTGEQFGDQRLCDVIAALPQDLTAHQVAERVLAALREFLGDEEPQDDITLLVLRALAEAPVVTELPRTPEAVAAG